MHQKCGAAFYLGVILDPCVFLYILFQNVGRNIDNIGIYYAKEHNNLALLGHFAPFLIKRGGKWPSKGSY